MLLKLVVKNFAIIEEITLEFENNLSVITGETGAGKSILLGALELILGKRANHSVILNKEEKCIVEATFKVDKNSRVNDFLQKHDIEVYSDLIIRREISPNGRSRAFLNDTPVNLDNIQEIGSQLVDMHRQFDNYELLQPKEQLSLLDGYLQLHEERANYQSNFTQYKKLFTELQEKKLAIKTAKAEQDYLEFVWNEIESLNLSDNAIEDWNKQLDLLENAQSIKETLAGAAQTLNHNEQSIISALQNIAKETKQYSDLSEQIEAINSRLLSTIEELKDISTEIEIQEDSINTDEEKLVQLQERLELGNKLLHKHNAQSTKELIEIRNQFQNKLEQISNASSDIQGLEKQLQQIEEKCKDQSEKLSKKRIKGLKQFNAQMNKMLPDLGFLNASFDTQHSFTEMNIDGIDSIQFLFDANNIGKLKELKQSVSGGENE